MSKQRDNLVSRLNEYKVSPAEDEVVKRTLAAGTQLILQSHANRVSLWQRILNQFKHMSILLWGTDIAVLFICIFLIHRIDVDTDITSLLSMLSFFVAILGIVGFPEICKGFSYQMWELEQSCKYNLQQIVTMKFVMIGIFDLLLITILTITTSQQIRLSLWETAVYLFVPFNLSCITAFFAIDFIRNKGRIWPIFFAGFIAALFILICVNRFSLYENISTPIWVVAYVVTLAVLVNKTFNFFEVINQGGFLLCN